MSTTPKKLLYSKYRTPLRLSQSVFSLLYLFLILKYSPITETKIPNYFNPYSILLVLESMVNRCHLVLSFISFFTSSLFAEYDENKRQFMFYKNNHFKCLADKLFPIGLPEGLTIILSAFWLFNTFTMILFPSFYIIELISSSCLLSLNSYTVKLVGFNFSHMSFSGIKKYAVPMLVITNNLLWLASAALIIDDLSI